MELLGSDPELYRFDSRKLLYSLIPKWYNLGQTPKVPFPTTSMNGDIVYSGTVRGIGQISMIIGPQGVSQIRFGKSCIKGRFNRRLTNWFRAYLRGRPRKFPYRIRLTGTPFQMSVWRAIAIIPYGETRSYRWIANRIGRPNAVRAVGNACGANPLPLVIPCHRVVSSNSLGGFSAGLHIKKKLLRIESSL